VKADLSLIRTASQVVKDYLRSSGNHLDLLVLSLGIATIQGFTPTAEGVDVKLALHLYSRVAAALEASSALEASGGSCLFVLSAGVHSVPESLDGLDEHS
jgi:hypothetical protein